MPKVSVCVPTYNTARYLPDAIESVLGQTFTDFELVICDNASTDETPTVCARYEDSRIRYVRFEELVSQGGNWNRCVALAHGEYVALLHADDRYLPTFLEQRVKILDEHPEVGLAFGAVDLINPEGKRFGSQVLRQESFTVPAPDFFPMILMGCIVNPVSPMVRRRCYDAIPPFEERRFWGIDWEMWIRIASRFGVAYSAEIAAEYRTHSDSGTTTALLRLDSCKDDWDALEIAFQGIAEFAELKRFAPLKKRALRSFALRRMYVAGCNAELGHVEGVKENLRWVLKSDPWLVRKPTFLALSLSIVFGPGIYRRYRALMGSRRPIVNLTT